jgi:hypothetical protein
VDPSRSDASLYLRCLGDVVLGNHREDSDGGRDTPWYTQSVSPIDSGFQKLQTKSLQTLSVDACNEIQIQIKVARISKNLTTGGKDRVGGGWGGVYGRGG